MEGIIDEYFSIFVVINKLFEAIIIDTENFLLEIFQLFRVIKVLFQNLLFFIFQYLLYLSD